MTTNTVLEQLQALGDKEYINKQKYFGINTSNSLGIRIPLLRELAKPLRNNHKLALDLWTTKIHEARILATFIENPKEIDRKQADNWINDFDSWDICDQTCSLLVKTEFVLELITDYKSSQYEYVKRASFTLMALMAVHHKNTDDQIFFNFLDLIEQESTDNRKYVYKAVNWALRQIGKRNQNLKLAAIQKANSILQKESKSAQWISKDALRELKNK